MESISSRFDCREENTNKDTPLGVTENSNTENILSGTKLQNTLGKENYFTFSNNTNMEININWKLLHLIAKIGIMLHSYIC